MYMAINKSTMKYFVFFGLLMMLGCSDKKSTTETTVLNTDEEKKTFNIGAVYADNEFKGARLNDFTKINDTTYRALISAESTPINNSPWFSFRIWSEKNMRISLEIVYTEGYKHRYIPKLSGDGISWKPLPDLYYEIDTINGKILIDMHLTQKKLWVSSQENRNSEYMNTWIDSLAKKEFIEKEIIGESALGQPLNLLKIKNETSKHAIVLLGRQHPTEVPGGTISLKAFVRTILSESLLANEFREKFEIVVIPLLNPDGVDAGNWRFNANGKDLNRDWISFSQPETKAVRDWMRARTSDLNESKFRFGIDFHTSYSGPYLLTLDTIPHKVKPIITSEWISSIEDLTRDTLDIRPRSQSLPYCYNWMINEVGIEAVTYEEGDEIERSMIKLRAKNYASTLMQTLIDEYY